MINRCINDTCAMYYMYLSCIVMACLVIYYTCHVMSCTARRWPGKDIQLKGLFDDHKAVMERTGLDRRFNYVP